MKKIERGGDYGFDITMTMQRLNDLIDLVNSQQEEIEKLGDRLSFFEVYGNPSSVPPEPTNDKAESNEERLISELHSERDKLNDSIRNQLNTHRTVTLRIPKGMTICEALDEAYMNVEELHLDKISDTDLQKALDEVEYE